MTLTEYLDDSKETIEQFAKRAGVHPATLFRLKNGDSPSGSTIKRVVRASSGKITPAELLGIQSKKAG